MRLLPLLAVAGIAAAACLYFRREEDRRGEPRDLYAGGPVPDDVLAQRVRTRISHMLGNPQAIDTRCSHGVVVLRGTLPRLERDRTLAAVLAVPGVTRVANYLDSPDKPDELVGNQGSFSAPV